MRPPRAGSILGGSSPPSTPQHPGTGFRSRTGPGGGQPPQGWGDLGAGGIEEGFPGGEQQPSPGPHRLGWDGNSEGPAPRRTFLLPVHSFFIIFFFFFFSFFSLFFSRLVSLRNLLLPPAAPCNPPRTAQGWGNTPQPLPGWTVGRGGTWGYPEHPTAPSGPSGWGSPPLSPPHPRGGPGSCPWGWGRGRGCEGCRRCRPAPEPGRDFSG